MKLMRYIPIFLAILLVAACSNTPPGPKNIADIPGDVHNLLHPVAVSGPGIRLMPAPTDTNGLQQWLTDIENFLLNVPDLQAANTDALSQVPPDLIASQCYLGLVAVRPQVDALISLLQLPKPPAGAGLASTFQALRDAKAGIGPGNGAVVTALGNIRRQINLSCAALFIDTTGGVIDPASLFTGPK